MTLCETLQQRWQACRARVYGEERVSDFAYCNLWGPHLTREEAFAWRAAAQRRGNRWHCSSPRRHQCRRGTTMQGRNVDPDRWSCAGREVFLGPLMWSPIDAVIWYERPSIGGRRNRVIRVPFTGWRWNWFDANLEPAP